MEITPELIELITAEVKKYVLQKSNNVIVKKNILILGNKKQDLKELEEIYNVFFVEDYSKNQDISIYEFIIISEISNSQLCDITQGRDNNPFTCAVIKASLTGKTVYMLPNAESYKYYINTGNKNLLKLLQEYSKTLLSFGIEVRSIKEILEVGTDKICNDSNKSYEDNIILDKQNNLNTTQSSSIVSYTDEKLISGQRAREIVKKCDKVVNLKKGTILTPLAKDVFFSARININYL